jgi:hypothetical protein
VSTPASGAIDQTSYRQRVLATLKKQPVLDLADPFFIVDLDPSCDDTELFRARIAALVAFWNKENSPSYKPLAKQLSKSRSSLEEVLLDPAARAQARARVVAVRGAVDAEALAALDSLAATLKEKFGGVPASRQAQLRAVALTRGLGEAGFARWWARQSVKVDAPVAASLSAALRREIRATLDEYGQLTGDPARAATLWSFLGLEPGASDSAVEAAMAQATAGKGLRGHDRRKTVTANLLAFAKTHAAGPGRTAYSASLREDAKDAVASYVTERSIVDGEISSTDYEVAVRKARALGYGITTEQARAVVRELAGTLGVPVRTGEADDIVLCPSCREPQSAKGASSCRYCGVTLFTSCPGCHKKVEAAASNCPHCNQSFAAVREVRAAIKDGEAALAAGELGRARRARDDARRASREAPASADDVTALDSAVQAAVTATERSWSAIIEDMAARRTYAAMTRLVGLTRTACDVPGPSRALPQTVLDELRELCTELDGRATAAVSLPPAEQEQALHRILEVAVDHPRAAGALAALPLPSPLAPRARLEPDGVAVSWRPVAQPGVSYRVIRNVLRADGTAISSHTVTTTGVTSVSDASVGVGVLVSYDIAATAHRRNAEVVRTAPLLVERDLTHVTVGQDGEDIVLSWSLAIEAGAITVDRTVVSGPAAPMRRGRGGIGSFRDTGAQAGVRYAYHVYAEYSALGGASVRTAGVTVEAGVVRRPRPVRDLYAVTTSDTTTLSWAPPPSGEVRIFAANRPLAQPDTEVALANVAKTGRYVGSGRRRCLDPSATGQVVYTPVTVDGSRAVAGVALAHMAVPALPPLGVTDFAGVLHVSLDFPAGITEAVLVVRRGVAPAGSEDAQALLRKKVTNAALEAGGGLVKLDVPDDGSVVHLAAFPAVRVNGKLVIAPSGTRLVARQASQAQVRYTVRRSGLLRRSLTVDISATPAIPYLRVMADPGPGSTAAPLELKVIPRGDGKTVMFDIATNSAPTPWVLSVLPAALATGVVVTAPPHADRLVP